MAYEIRFPAYIAYGLEQTWRFDEWLHGDSKRDYFDIQRSIIEQQEPLNAILDMYLNENDLVLEAGCGSGRWMSHLDKKGYHSVGVDISAQILHIINQIDPSLRLLTGDIHTLPIKAEAFDAILSSYVAEHFKEGPVPLLREAHRVLKPGGILFFLVPFNSLLRRLVFNRLLDLACYYYRPRRRNGRMTFVEYRFGRRECRRFLEESGFKILQFHPDEFFGGWNKGVTCDYRNLQFYWPRLADLPDNYLLPGWAQRLTSAILKIHPWSCCGGLICVAQKPSSQKKVPVWRNRK